MSSSSYRTILRSSSIIAAAQVVSVAASLAKLKVAAVLLGPVGVGLAGLYMNLAQTAASIAALGVSNVGTRQIASAYAAGGDVAVGRARRTLFWGVLLLAIIGAALFWLSSGWIARTILADSKRAGDVAWLSLAVAATVAAGWQSSLLTGMRRVGYLAQINAGSAVLGAALGVAALWRWGADGLLPMILIGPLATLLLGLAYVARLGRPAGQPAGLGEMAREWRTMAQLGSAFMISGLVGTLSALLARTLVQRELGSDALGQFQAAWALGMTYIGFILGAMGTDYYPRLTAAISDPAAATRLVNEQTEVALLLCGPVLVAMLGFAPWVIRLLYSADFGPAVDVLRWQLLGDVLKVMSWPLGFVILAAGAGKTFAISETVSECVFLLAMWIGLPLIGVSATGVGFVALYLVYLPLVWWLARRRIGFRWTRQVKVSAIGIIGAAAMVDFVGRWSDLAGAVVGTASAAVMGLFALARLSSAAGVTTVKLRPLALFRRGPAEP